MDVTDLTPAITDQNGRISFIPLCCYSHVSLISDIEVLENPEFFFHDTSKELKKRKFPMHFKIGKLFIEKKLT